MTRQPRACAWRLTACPAEIDEVQRKLMQMEIEREALKKEKDKASQERLEKLNKEIAALKEQARRHEAALAAGKGDHPGHPVPEGKA